MKDYVIFIPPKSNYEKDRKEWTKSEAKDYLKWFLSVQNDRTNELLSFFEIINSEDDLLLLLGRRIKDSLRSSDLFFNDLEGKLTNQGYSLSQDLAILVSNLLLKKRPELFWSIVGKPTSDINFNLPAIYGFKNKKYYVDYMRAIVVHLYKLKEDRTDETFLQVLLDSGIKQEQ